MVRVKLDLTKDITHLAGNELGRHICLSQVIPYLKGESLEIEMPEHIDGVALGFVQGMKAILMLENEELDVTFVAKNERLTQKLMRDYNY